MIVISISDAVVTCVSCAIFGAAVAAIIMAPIWFRHTKRRMDYYHQERMRRIDERHTERMAEIDRVYDDRAQLRRSSGQLGRW